MSALKILVVDDYKASAMVTGRMFELFGHEVHLAYNGTEAMAKAEQIRPDLVLLDLGMPEMDGFETCRKLRANPDFQKTQIIAQTGRGDDATIAACEEAGFNRHFLKPVPLESIENIAKFKP